MSRNYDGPKWPYVLVFLPLIWAGSCSLSLLRTALRPLPPVHHAYEALTPIDAPYAEPVVTKTQGPDYAPAPASTHDYGTAFDYPPDGGYSGRSRSGRSRDSGPKDVFVHGYTRRDGTPVRSHYRSSPRR